MYARNSSMKGSVLRISLLLFCLLIFGSKTIKAQSYRGIIPAVEALYQRS
jgi:hypothetical protein